MAPPAPAPPTFRDDPLLAILAHVAQTPGTVTFRVLDPDRARGHYAGEPVIIDGVRYLHRPWRTWLELADRLGLRLATPRPAPPPYIEVILERLAVAHSRTPHAADAPATERYGADSPFARLAKHEDPGFVVDLTDAVHRVGLTPDARVLELGVGRGDALVLLGALVPGLIERGTLVGVDHSASALAAARTRLPRATFHEADLGALDALALGGPFDLVASFSTFQSPSVDDRALLRSIVQRHLTPRGAVILGVPNCAYADGELLAGARVKNYAQAELGTALKDVVFYRRYLQQHGRKVYVTGTHELLVTAVACGAEPSPAR